MQNKKSHCRVEDIKIVNTASKSSLHNLKSASWYIMSPFFHSLLYNGARLLYNVASKNVIAKFSLKNT